MVRSRGRFCISLLDATPFCRGGALYDLGFRVYTVCRVSGFRVRAQGTRQVRLFQLEAAMASMEK